MTTGRSIEQTAADYRAMMSTDPKAAELYCELGHSGDPDPYTYPEGSNRDESRMCDEASDHHSNRIMRKFLADVELKVCSERQADYDSPDINHPRTAIIASTCTEHEITAADVCMINLAQKMARCKHKITYDSLLDIAGYASNLAVLLESGRPLNGT